jgi:SAM-dependent methyltransferase
MHGTTVFTGAGDVQDQGLRDDAVGVPYLALRALLNGIPADIPRTTFVDYGCGIGRVLVAARHAGFARVIGVEPAASLVAVARINMRGYAGWEIVHSHPSHFQVPDDASTFFLGTPLAGMRLAKVLLRIQRSIARQPRPHVILGYYHVDVMAATARRAGLPLKRVLQGYYSPAERTWAGWTFDVSPSRIPPQSPSG